MYLELLFWHTLGLIAFFETNLVKINVGIAIV